MRIDPQRMVPITEPKPRDTGARRDAGSADKSAVVQLSEAATAAAEPGPSGVTARIAAIREALAQDAYPIDFDLLASRIVDDEIGRGGK